jgi:hypothetical protein
MAMLRPTVEGGSTSYARHNITYGVESIYMIHVAIFSSRGALESADRNRPLPRGVLTGQASCSELYVRKPAAALPYVVMLIVQDHDNLDKAQNADLRDYVILNNELDSTLQSNQSNYTFHAEYNSAFNSKLRSYHTLILPYHHLTALLSPHHPNILSKRHSLLEHKTSCTIQASRLSLHRCLFLLFVGPS